MKPRASVGRFESLLSAYEVECRTALRLRTSTARVVVAARWLRWCDQKGCAISPSSFRQHWAEVNGRWNEQTRQQYYFVYRYFARWLVERGQAAQEFTSGMRPPRCLHRAPIVSLSVESVRLLRLPDFPQTDKGVRNQALIEVFWSSGARIGEIASMTMENTDLLRGEARVAIKGGTEGEIYLSPQACALTREWVKRAGILSGSVWRLSSVGIWWMVRDRAIARQIPERVHPHIFRHTYATALLDGGASLTDLQALLNHKSVTSTVRYIHASNRRKRAATALHPAFHDLPE